MLLHSWHGREYSKEESNNQCEKCRNSVIPTSHAYVIRWWVQLTGSLNRWRKDFMFPFGSFWRYCRVGDWVSEKDWTSSVNVKAVHGGKKPQNHVWIKYKAGKATQFLCTWFWCFRRRNTCPYSHAQNMKVPYATAKMMNSLDVVELQGGRIWVPTRVLGLLSRHYIELDLLQLDLLLCKKQPLQAEQLYVKCTFKFNAGWTKFIDVCQQIKVMRNLRAVTKNPARLDGEYSQVWMLIHEWFLRPVNDAAGHHSLQRPLKLSRILNIRFTVNQR